MKPQAWSPGPGEPPAPRRPGRPCWDFPSAQNGNRENAQPPTCHRASVFFHSEAEFGLKRLRGAAEASRQRRGARQAGNKKADSPQLWGGRVPAGPLFCKPVTTPLPTPSPVHTSRDSRPLRPRYTMSSLAHSPEPTVGTFPGPGGDSEQKTPSPDPAELMGETQALTKNTGCEHHNRRVGR